MVKGISLLIIAMSFFQLLTAQPEQTRDQQEVQQTIVKMFEALSNRDTVALKMHCTNDVTFYEYGQVWNIDTLIRRGITLNQAADFKRTNSFSFIYTESNKSTAWATYRLNSVLVVDGKHIVVDWLETVLLMRERRLWKVKHLHSTLVSRR
jgi:ketosteroid isomerase-like protein